MKSLTLLSVMVYYLYLCNCMVASIPLPWYNRPTYSSYTNVVDYGAVGDGSTDDSEAFLAAWQNVCQASDDNQVLLVPSGSTFLLKPLVFKGPCQASSIRVQVEGELVAPRKVDDWINCKKIKSWITFENIEGLRIIGGRFDGRGSLWWNNREIKKKCSHSAPTALKFQSCSNVRLEGSSHVNSPRNHISIYKSQDVELSNFQIVAPESSPNTDGIDIADSTNIQIHNSHIRTGDDCIAIDGGSSYINIESVFCEFGHGISIGSLGEYGDYDVVEHVNIRDCSFGETQNGVRIKTWEGGSGYARNIVFENINFQNTKNPIIINQHYIDRKEKSGKSTEKDSAVHVRDVTYRGMQGTSQTKNAITLLCSEFVPCRNLRFYDIDISSGGEEMQTHIENAEVIGLS